MSIETTINFDNAANFTFAANKIEITGAAAQLVNQLPANATFHANFSSSIDGTWGDGVLTGTKVGTGGPLINNGKLNFTANVNAHVDYDADLNADSQQTGTVRFLLTPNYSGAPAEVQYFFTITKADSDASNCVELQHNTDTNLILTVCGSDSLTIFTLANAFIPTSGVEVEIEVDWDLTSGVTTVFIDGIVHKATSTGTGLRDSNIALLRLGASISGVRVDNEFEIDDFIYFSTVQHTANYTPGASIPTDKFATDDPTIEIASSQAVDGISAFSAVLTAAGSDAIQFSITVDGVDKYWTGSVWATANGTFSQSNTIADINTNILSLDLSAGANIKWKAFLSSDDGNTTPDITSLTYSYNFFVQAPTALQECVVFGTLIDPEGDGISGASVDAIVKTDIFNGGFQVMKSRGSTITNSSGFWELSLVETVTVGGKVTIRFKTVDNVNGSKITEREIGIPNQVSAAFKDLV